MVYKKLFNYTTVIILIALVILILPVSLQAKSEISGNIESNNYFLLDSGRIETSEVNLNLKFEGSKQRYHFFSDVVLGSTSPSSISGVSDLASISTVLPLYINLKEAYIDIYSFPINFMDIRLGKQIIVWGTADKLNPTSNLSPTDLRNIFNFGEKIGVTGLKFDLYLDTLQFEGAIVPYFNPSPLPENFNEFSGSQLGTDHIEMPDDYLGKNISIGLKTSYSIGSYDFSFSYFYGRYWIPVAYKIELDSQYTVKDTYMFFPRLHVAGFDFSGYLGDAGIWGECGIFIPEEYYLETYVSNLIVDSEKKSEFYPRYVLGGDYTFSNGIYINVQFAHGLDFETQKDLLKDYLMFRVEKTFFNDKIKLLPATIFTTTGDINNIKDNIGIGYMPEIQFFPSDNTELKMGTILLEGKGDNLIKNIEKKDSLYVEFKVSF